MITGIAIGLALNLPFLWGMRAFAARRRWVLLGLTIAVIVAADFMAPYWLPAITPDTNGSNNSIIGFGIGLGIAFTSHIAIQARRAPRT